VKKYHIYGRLSTGNFMRFGRNNKNTYMQRLFFAARIPNENTFHVAHAADCHLTAPHNSHIISMKISSVSLSQISTGVRYGVGRYGEGYRLTRGSFNRHCITGIQ
jgi:hypothetical protein